MMNTNTIIRWLTIAGMALGLSVPAVGAEKHTGDDSGKHEEEFSSVVTPNKKPEDRQLIRVSDEKPVASTEEERLYRPPSRGAPGGRVGGGTRGPSMDLPLLYALVPDHVGLTTEEQPLFVWYLSKATSHPLEFTVIDEVGVAPIIEQRLSSPAEPGVNIIQSAQYGLKLDKGKKYQWFVSLISDPERRSKDIIAGGMIELGELPPSLEENVTKAHPIQATKLLAQAGFWYDAMGVISTNIQANPSDLAMHDIRASLLEQVDLNTVAQVDHQRGL